MAVTKAVLRREAAVRRQAAFAAAPADCGTLMADHVMAYVAPLLEAMGPVAIGGYVAIRTEADPAPVLMRLRNLGAPIALPRISGSSLVFHAHAIGDALLPGPHGTLEPSETSPLLAPSILIVPLLAFDYAGMRLGYGGGYYDRALKGLRSLGSIRAIGLAFEVQKSDLLPRDLSDEPLDAVATELRLREFRRGWVLRLLFLGDIVGRAGRQAVTEAVPELRRSLALDCVIVNGENAAGGFGITEDIANSLFAIGVDLITTGNHAFDQRESAALFDNEMRLLRPANYPQGVPGRGSALIETKSGARVLAINVMGRIFMDPLDDPFTLTDRLLSECPIGTAADAIVVDIHAEATSEKMAMGQFCDGRVSLVVGTHSHVPTADAQILPGGTAYQTDAGACADYDSVIGMEKTEPLHRFLMRTSAGKMNPAQGPATVCGVFVEIDPRTGLALRVEPVRVGGRLKPALPEG